MVRLVFLDIDGVLNSMQFILKMQGLFDNPAHQIDPDAVKRLNRLTDATGAFIVVSSTWRLPFVIFNQIDQLKELMASHGITAPVLGATPNTNGNRGSQIQLWLNDHPDLDVGSFIILDDDSDMGDLTSRLVKTKFDDGLQDSHVAQAIALLLGSSK